MGLCWVGFCTEDFAIVSLFNLIMKARNSYHDFQLSLAPIQMAMAWIPELKKINELNTLQSCVLSVFPKQKNHIKYRISIKLSSWHKLAFTRLSQVRNISSAGRDVICRAALVVGFYKNQIQDKLWIRETPLVKRRSFFQVQITSIPVIKRTLIT